MIDQELFLDEWNADSFDNVDQQELAQANNDENEPEAIDEMVGTTVDE